MFNDSLKQITKKDFRCVVSRWLDNLDVEDQHMVAKALEEHPLFTVYRACLNYGYNGSQSAFYRHGKGLCQCSIMS
jgi:hypothetical protein